MSAARTWRTRLCRKTGCSSFRASSNERHSAGRGKRMSASELTTASLAGLSRMLAAREVSAVEVARNYLARIESQRGLNAFLDVRPEVTLAQAAAADARITRGDATPLTGIPI